MGDDRYNLYVGNLHPTVNESLLRDIFTATGAQVGQVKIIQADKSQGNYNYGFIEMFDKRQAEIALNSLDKREILGVEVKVNWANGGSTKKEDTSNHYHIFVGDLSSDVNDQILLKAFSAFGSVSEARVMWDTNTGKSRGYGFVAFRDKVDAEQAIAQMNGQWLGNRAIRCNWANQKILNEANSMKKDNSPPANDIISQGSPTNTTVYIGNLTPDTTKEHLQGFFQQYGNITEVRVQQDKGYGFVKYDNHESASTAIYNMNGKQINGRAIKCSWGKDRTATQAAPAVPPMMYPHPGMANVNPYMYGGYYQMPGQPTYGYEYYAGYDPYQYGYPAQYQQHQQQHHQQHHHQHQ